ncbi:MAG: PaaI family thioesterase [Firmicutes bacterium]|nr:PaaI family thioesterase [Bacillota bacterium]
MVVYKDIESMLADGIVAPRQSPPCVEIMQREFVEYVVGSSLTCAYPVLPMYSNPRRSMQGGFICAAFDNTFGMLVYLTAKTLDMATVDLDVNYHKPIFENDKLVVTVALKSLGKTIIHIVGEARNRENELIASATTNIYLRDKRSK